MDFLGSRRFRALYAAHSVWLGELLARGFLVHLAPQVSMRFPGFRRPVDLHTALADTFETYLAQEAKPVPLGAPGISVCRASLLDCAHEVVRQRLIRVISARAAFDWPLPMEAR